MLDRQNDEFYQVCSRPAFQLAPKIREENRISQGDLNRGTESAETETPKASSGWGMGRGIPFPILLRGLGERRKLLQRGHDFSAFKASQNASGCTADEIS